MKKGNSTKTILVYAEVVSNSPLSSNAGIKMNLSKVTLDLKIGLHDAGLKFSITKNNITSSASINISIAEMKIGFEAENEENIDENTTQSAYVNSSLNGLFLLGAYAFSQTGSWSSSPAFQE